jgi:lipopolysaccharide biosynthesis regulator YciM
MYLRRGLHDEAESCLTILLEKEPGHSQGRRLLLGSLLSSGKVDEARSLMEGWLEKDEPRPSVCPACGHRDRDLSLRCVRCGAWQPAEPPRSR